VIRVRQPLDGATHATRSVCVTRRSPAPRCRLARFGTAPARPRSREGGTRSRELERGETHAEYARVSRLGRQRLTLERGQPGPDRRSGRGAAVPIGTYAPHAFERSADHDRCGTRGRTCGPRRSRTRYWGEPSEPMGDLAWPAFGDRHAGRAVPFHQAVRCSRSADWEYGAIGHISERCDGPAALLPLGVHGMAVGAGQLRTVPHARLAEQRGDHAPAGIDATAARFAVRTRALLGDVVRPTRRRSTTA
jgi:hypothetical protein